MKPTPNKNDANCIRRSDALALLSSISGNMVTHARYMKPPAVKGNKTSCSNPSTILPENNPNAVPKNAAIAVTNCAPIAMLRDNPALTNVAKSPNSCGIS
mmetsp:Transcript_14626/g.30665  ORF Transcript_14626/g.30665 Transcript_14626/m.30665 type:complete len:100 (+) Transcript_14626:2043-2342(+)